MQTIPSSWLPPRWVLVALLVGSVGWLFYALRGVLTPIFAAFLIAYVLDPVVDRLEARKIPRALAIMILLAGLLGVVGLFVVLVLPGVVRDVAGFVRELPHQVTAALQRTEPWLARYGIHVPHSVAEALAQYQVDAQDVAQRAIAPVGAILRWIVGGTSSLIGMLGTVFIVPVVSFYLLYDFDRMKDAATALVPNQWREPVVEIAREIDETLGHFVRGQLIVMAILGVLYAIAYSALGVRLAIPIGIVAGLIAFIPYVGSATALLSALLLSLIDFTGWGKVIGVLAAYVVIQLLEGFVITPRIVGEKVGLPPVWVLIALLVGAELFGFLGVLLALPTAAVLKIFVMRGLRTYRASRIFAGGGPEEAARAESLKPVLGAGELEPALSPGDLSSARSAEDLTPALSGGDLTPALSQKGEGAAGERATGPGAAPATIVEAVLSASERPPAPAREVPPELADLAAEAAAIEPPPKPEDGK